MMFDRLIALSQGKTREKRRDLLVLISEMFTDGAETYTISGIADIAPRKTLAVTATKTDGATVNFEVIARLDTEVDVEYFRHGGILPYVLRKLMA